MRATVLGVGALVVVVVAGCSSQKHASSPSAAPNEGDEQFFDVAIASLPRGRVPELPKDQPKDLKDKERIPGVNVVHWSAMSSMEVLQGPNVPEPKPLNDGTSESYEDRRVQKDPENAASNYCIALTNEDSRSRVLPSYSTPFIDPLILAERFDGAPGKASLHVLTGWGNPSTVSMRRHDERTLPMQLIGTMAGVEVYAFFDDTPEPPPPPPPAPPPPPVVTKGKKGKPVTPIIEAQTENPPPPITKHVGPEVNIVVRRPALTRGNILDATIAGQFADGSSVIAHCRHARVGLPVTRGNGSSGKFLVGVETPRGGRVLRVNLNALWLGSGEARLTGRIGWASAEREKISLTSQRTDENGRPDLDTDTIVEE